MQAIAQPVHLHLGIAHEAARIDRSEPAIGVKNTFGLEASITGHTFSKPPAGIASALGAALLTGLLPALLALAVLPLALALRALLSLAPLLALTALFPLA